MELINCSTKIEHNTWISVNYALPEVDAAGISDRVIVYDPEGRWEKIEFAYYNEENPEEAGSEWFWETDLENTTTVTHWQYSPEIPTA